MENWFKISADIFDNKKIKIIRAMRNGDSMALMWFFLLSVARQQNDNGYVYATEGVAYTPKTLAAVSGFKPKLVETALDIFQQYNMIDIEDNGYIYIVGWDEYQNTEALAKLKDKRTQGESDKEKTRLRVAKYRQKQKCNDICNANTALQTTNCNVTCNDGNADGNADVTLQNVTSNAGSDSVDNPIGFWNHNIAPITAYLSERIHAVMDDYGESIAMEAMRITAQQGKKSIAYFEAVSKNLAAGESKPKKQPNGFTPAYDQNDLDNLF